MRSIAQVCFAIRVPETSHLFMVELNCAWAPMDKHRPRLRGQHYDLVGDPVVRIQVHPKRRNPRSPNLLSPDVISARPNTLISSSLYET